MQPNEWSLKTCFSSILLAMLTVMMALSIVAWRCVGETWILAFAAALMLCALLGNYACIQVLAGRLQRFSDELCATITRMMEADASLPVPRDSEALFDRISQRLLRLQTVQQSQRRRLDEERQALQGLVSDIAHQVRTPMSNIQMLCDTLLEQSLSDEDCRTFLGTMRVQTDKLAFLIEALVKTSRLETGLVHIEKSLLPVYDTVAQALSGVVSTAEQKKITVTVDCPENLQLSYDSRWTAEALFNLLDNAVKYAPVGGKVRLAVTSGEMFAAFSVHDNGPGIPESQQAQVFQRFYRAPSVHEIPGVGLGLYLAREIVTRQGGYIRLSSAPGQGTEFSIMLPLRETR